MLAHVGRQEEALASADEAVELRRRLAEANPAAYLPDLAASLAILGGMLATSDAARRLARPGTTQRPGSALKLTCCACCGPVGNGS